jgi:hypothetical protein
MASSIERTGVRVVAHFKGGRLLKGYTQDFNPDKDTFTLVSEQRRDKGKTYQVRIADLKAVFFVRALEGNIFYREKKKFREVNMSHLRGIGIRLHFKDGEVIRGASLDYAVGKKAFFVTPVDPESNNERVYVVADALLERCPSRSQSRRGSLRGTDRLHDLQPRCAPHLSFIITPALSKSPRALAPRNSRP